MGGRRGKGGEEKGEKGREGEEREGGAFAVNRRRGERERESEEKREEERRPLDDRMNRCNSGKGMGEEEECEKRDKSLWRDKVTRAAREKPLFHPNRVGISLLLGLPVCSCRDERKGARERRRE